MLVNIEYVGLSFVHRALPRDIDDVQKGCARRNSLTKLVIPGRFYDHSWLDAVLGMTTIGLCQIRTVKDVVFLTLIQFKYHG